MKDPALQAAVVTDVVLLATVGVRIVLVHGGGPEINQWLKKLGIESKFDPGSGLRITDGPTMDVVEMVLVGRVNKQLVSLIQSAGGRAVGMCGKDGRLLTARKITGADGADLGFVGEVTMVDPRSLNAVLLDDDDGVEGCPVPVVATVAMDHTGQALNVNADTAAGELAAALGAEKLVLMTDVAASGPFVHPSIRPSIHPSTDPPTHTIRAIHPIQTIASYSSIPSRV